MKKDTPLHERPSVLERLILFVRRGNLHARSVWILLVSSVRPILIYGFGAFSGARYLFEQYNYNSIQKSMDLYGMLLDSQLSQYAQIGDEIAANLNTISIVANRHANNTAQYARIGEQYQYIEKLFIRHMIAVEIVADDGCVMFQPYQFTNPDAPTECILYGGNGVCLPAIVGLARALWKTQALTPAPLLPCRTMKSSFPPKFVH